MGFDSHEEFRSWQEDDKRRKSGFISVNKVGYDELVNKAKRLNEALDYVLTAKPEHYHSVENMLEDFKTVINLTLQGK